MNKDEKYQKYQLQGRLMPTTEDGIRYEVRIVDDGVQLFTETTFITGTACAMKFGARISDDVVKNIADQTLLKAKARLSLQLFEQGRDYLQDISSTTLKTPIIPVDDAKITKWLLKGLLNIRRSNPLKYKFYQINVDGFCLLLSITKDQYLFNATVLLEDGLIEQSSIAQLALPNGGIYITSKGINELSAGEFDHGSAEEMKSDNNAPSISKNEFEYDIAISFAGEDREIAEKIALALRNRGLNVFYDDFEKVSLWGKNLYDYLSHVYNYAARYCIILLSESYATKNWTSHERKSAQARAFKEKYEYILPIKLDETKIPGILETVGYISISNTPISEIVDLIIKKIGQ